MLAVDNIPLSFIERYVHRIIRARSFQNLNNIMLDLTKKIERLYNIRTRLYYNIIIIIIAVYTFGLVISS